MKTRILKLTFLIKDIAEFPEQKIRIKEIKEYAKNMEKIYFVEVRDIEVK